ncbi:MAG: hypothetical protein GWP27_10170 [Bacteroidetes bacterium]|nr:hypothetical protein [Bacteroidota bacterium]
MTINNVGTFGNAFRGSYDVLGYSSAEFPANTGIEHLFEGGIWVGGKVNGSLIAVSTAAYDQTAGYSAGRAGYEFTAEIGGQFIERSSLIDNPSYSVEAVSHQDFIGDFSDRNVLVPGTQIQISNHDNPMEIDIHMESYNWNYAFSDFMLICNYELTSTGNNTLNDVFIGMWSNEVVRNTNITPAGQGGSAFYDKGGNGFIDSLGLAYCYDATGDEGFTDSYVGHKFLGAEDNSGFHHPSLDTAFKMNYQTWQFNSVGQPVFFFPNSELQRYTKMEDGLNQWPCWTETGSLDPRCGQFQSQTIQEVINQSGNRSDLVSVGPFKSIEPGETIQFAWAWVFAKKNEDGNPNSDNNVVQRANLLENALWAQTAYNGEDANFNGELDEGEDADGDGEITRFILPTPPDIPKTKVVARNGGLDMYWSDNAEASVDPISQEMDFEGYKIYLTKLGFDVTSVQDLSSDLKLAATYDVEGNGLFYDTGLRAIRLEEPATFDGDSIIYAYRYSIDNLVNGWQYVIALSAFDRGDESNSLESLESSFLSNSWAVFPGTDVNVKFEEYASLITPLKSVINQDLKDSLEQYRPFAYPNPYYSGASWEGTTAFEEDRKITFANLPKSCTIRVFTLSGDLIKTIDHDDSYAGDEIRWYETFSNPEKTVFSGSEHSWDLLSDAAQIIARGTYIFSVEDHESGNHWKERFVIIK